MNRRQISYFLAVSEARSFSGAAVRLRVAQPALSARIRELEESLGVRLFDRSPRGVTLTSHGNALLPYAQEIETAFERARLAVQIPVERKTVISIGVTPTIAATILPALLDVSEAGGSVIEWHAQQAAAYPLIDMLRAGEIDSALIYHDPAHKDLRGIPLHTEDMALVGLSSVVGKPRDIRFAELPSYPLALDQRSHLSRRVVEQAAAKRGVRLDIRAEVEPLPAKKRLIEQGCCTIVPRNAMAPELQEGRYAARRVIGPRLSITLFLLVSARMDDARASLILAAVQLGLSRAPLFGP